MGVATRIDADSHFLPDIHVSLLREELGQVFPSASKEKIEVVVRDTVRVAAPKTHAGGFKVLNSTVESDDNDDRGEVVSLSAIPGHSDPHERASLLGGTGFDMQVLIPDGIFSHLLLAPGTWDIGSDVRRSLVRSYNVGSSMAQKELPNVFIGTCILPLDDIADSCSELDRASQLGLRIVTLTGNWKGLNWDSEELFPIWKKISELGMLVYVHHVPFSCRVADHVPTTFTLGMERMRRLHISNYLGFAFEYMVGMAALTLGGVLEYFPDLRFCFFESGASWLPWALYTLDHVFEVEPQCARCRTLPSELILKHCLVAVEPDEAPIVDAIASIGSENFILGSDYPHPPSTYPNTVQGLLSLGISDKDVENILGNNIQRFLDGK